MSDETRRRAPPGWWDCLSLVLAALALLGGVLGAGLYVAHRPGLGAAGGLIALAAALAGGVGVFMLGRRHARLRRR